MPNSVVFPFEPLGSKLAHLHPSLGSINGPHLLEGFVEQRYGKDWMLPPQNGVGSYDWLAQSDRGNGGFWEFLLQPSPSAARRQDIRVLPAA